MKAKATRFSLPSFPRAWRTMLTASVLALGVSVSATAAPTIEKTAKIEAGLYELVVSPSSGTVYVAATGKRGENAAQVIALDAKTLQQKQSIDVSAEPLFGLGLNEKTQTLYGTATRNGAVAAVDLKSGKVVATIKEGDRAHVREAIVDERANRVYVSLVGDEKSSAVWVIDGKTNTLAHIIAVPTKSLTGIALDAKRNRLYGTGMGAAEIVVIDLKKKEITQRWPAGGESPTNIAYDAKSDRLFVANQKSGSLTVLSARDGKLLKSVPTGEGALSVAFNPAANQVYVANRVAGTLSVVDAKSYEVVAQLPTGTLPQTIAVDRKNNLVYVSNKAKGLPRNAPADAKPVEDPEGDTIALIKP